MLPHSESLMNMIGESVSELKAHMKLTYPVGDIGLAARLVALSGNECPICVGDRIVFDYKFKVSFEENILHNLRVMNEAYEDGATVIDHDPSVLCFIEDVYLQLHALRTKRVTNWRVKICQWLIRFLGVDSWSLR